MKGTLSVQPSPRANYNALFKRTTGDGMLGGCSWTYALESEDEPVE